MTDHYYIRHMPHEPTQVWRIGQRLAVRLGVTNPENGPGSYYAASSEVETAFDVMKRQTPWFDQSTPFIRLELAAGCYHPRIARPVVPAETPMLWSLNSEPNFTASASSQAAVLIAELARICRVIHPAEDTMSTYGHDIRNLLLLAATDVEMHCRGILLANGAKDRQFTMKDYKSLAGVLCLADYSVRCPAFPWLKPVSPFSRWASDPNASLPWWSAYNAVKHDRDTEFHRASLGHAFEAVAACVILLVAQFGAAGGFGVESSLSRFFQFDKVPIWPDQASYCSFTSETGGRWNALHHPLLAGL